MASLGPQSAIEVDIDTVRDIPDMFWECGTPAGIPQAVPAASRAHPAAAATKRAAAAHPGYTQSGQIHEFMGSELSIKSRPTLVGISQNPDQEWSRRKNPDQEIPTKGGGCLLKRLPDIWKILGRAKKKYR